MERGVLGMDFRGILGRTECGSGKLEGYFGKRRTLPTLEREIRGDGFLKFVFNLKIIII